MGALTILTENRDQITDKLGFALNVSRVCSRHVHDLKLPQNVARSTDWREVVNDPEVQIVAELVGGCTVAREIINAAIEAGKSVVTANKELMAQCGSLGKAG